MRQPNPRQKRFRKKDGRGDGALRIGNLLIASKVPQAFDSAQALWPIPKSFHRGGFSRNILTSKGCINKKSLRECDSLESCSSPPSHAADCCRIPTAVGEQQAKKMKTIRVIPHFSF